MEDCPPKEERWIEKIFNEEMNKIIAIFIAVIAIFKFIVYPINDIKLEIAVMKESLNNNKITTEKSIEDIKKTNDKQDQDIENLKKVINNYIGKIFLTK